MTSNPELAALLDLAVALSFIPAWNHPLIEKLSREFHAAWDAINMPTKLVREAVSIKVHMANTSSLNPDREILEGRLDAILESNHE